MEASGRERRLKTAESVCDGHPDRVADCIADAVVDAALLAHPASRVACEVFVTRNLVVIGGEVSCPVNLPYEQIVRNTLSSLGYVSESSGISAPTCHIVVAVHSQTSEIAGLAEHYLTSDQGVVYGYATDETALFIPTPLLLARSLTQQLNELRQGGGLPYLLPDGKAQVTVCYEGNTPCEIADIVISPHYDGSVSHDQICADVTDLVIKKALPSELLTERTQFSFGPFLVGGPAADTGLTGRKLMVDAYGGGIPHGGGALSGKDPTKVDRSGAYLARYIAKNIVASGLAPECLIELAYRKGLSGPEHLEISLPRGARLGVEDLKRHLQSAWDLSLRNVITTLHLDTPIYSDTARRGHFGNPGFPWERLDCQNEWQALASATA